MSIVRSDYRHTQPFTLTQIHLPRIAANPDRCPSFVTLRQRAIKEWAQTHKHTSDGVWFICKEHDIWDRNLLRWIYCIISISWPHLSGRIIYINMPNPNDDKLPNYRICLILYFRKPAHRHWPHIYLHRCAILVVYENAQPFLAAHPCDGTSYGLRVCVCVCGMCCRYVINLWFAHKYVWHIECWLACAMTIGGRIMRNYRKRLARCYYVEWAAFIDSYGNAVIYLPSTPYVRVYNNNANNHSESI